MTREETKKIIRIISASYPNFNPPDLSEMVDVWNLMLEDFTYQQVSMALKSYILSDTKGFAPSIGQLVDKVMFITKPAIENEMEAWALVSKALRRGYYYAEEEFEKLPPLVQKAVGSASNIRNWAQTDYKSIENVIQSNFIRSYVNVCNREKEYIKLPNEIKTLIESTADKVMKIDKIEK